MSDNKSKLGQDLFDLAVSINEAKQKMAEDGELRCPECDLPVDLCDKCGDTVHEGDPYFLTGEGLFCRDCGDEWRGKSRCNYKKWN